MSYPVSITTGAAQSPLLFWSTLWDHEAGLGDWCVSPLSAPSNPGGLDTSRPMGSAVLISLFTDRRAPEGWRPEVTDRRGYWADTVEVAGQPARELGSHLWLLRNEVTSPENAVLARFYAEEALAWLTQDGVAAKVNVTSGILENPRRGIWLAVEILGRDGAQVYQQRFDSLWALERNNR